MTRAEIPPLAAFIGLTILAALVGSQFMPGEWYTTLQKPAFTPPGWLFAPVWSLLYLMIAVSGWLAWRASGLGLATSLWFVQLAANALWSYLFFGLHRIDLALVDILFLLALIVAYAVVVWPRARAAAVLFIPYAFWVGFASLLNGAIWRLNT